MTAGLETFAKVRALHDRATIPGEKAAAMTRMQTLARKAGMSVEEAVSKLDTPVPTIVASATFNPADAFNAFFNTPEMRAERAERDAKRRVEAAAIIERHGSTDALFADTPMEAAIRAACEPLLGPGETWRTIYRLDGWGSLSPDRDMPETVRTAVSEAWPLPATVAAAWAEYEETDALIRERYTVDMYCDPEPFTQARKHIVSVLLDTLPARSLTDMRARLSWLDFWVRSEVEQDVGSLRATLATLRADIERMGARIREQDAEPVQSGHDPDLDGRLKSQPVSPVQSGRSEGYASDAYPQRRTNTEKRTAVLTLFGQGLTNREIARRAGVSPQTVGNIRKAQP